MDAKKTKSPKAERSSIHVGNVKGSVVKGNISISGRGKFVGGEDHSQEYQQIIRMTANSWFQPVYDRIASPLVPAQKRHAIETTVREIETEIARGEKAKKSFLNQRLRNLRQMAPDIWEVILAMFANPVAGLGVVVSKLLIKLAEEGKKVEDEKSK